MERSTAKSEGIAFPPLPAAAGRDRERRARAAVASEPCCEMCGAAVIATHCKRICLRCGFMTGCSEGI